MIARLFFATFALVLCVLGVFGQAQTREDREAGFKQEIQNAKWVYLIKDDDGAAHYIDSQKMARIGSIVVFIMRYEKRGTAIYEKLTGGCTSDTLAIVSRFLSSPGARSPANWLGGEIEEPAFEKVQKGSVGYSMLDYACTKAKVVPVD